MTRPLRIEYPGAVYHVMNRGLARQAIFRTSVDYEMFLQALEESATQWGVEVFAYCLMPNHYHLCVRTPRGNLGRVMRHLNGVYTQRFNRTHRRDGPLFRGRYRAMLIEAEIYLTTVIRYIHLNPVQGQLCTLPDAYRWSSHPYYLKPHTAPSWLSIGEGLEGFGSPRAFQAFVVAGNEEACETFYANDRHPLVLGQEGFVEWVKTKASPLSREHPRHERAIVRPSVRQVLRGVAAVFGVPVSTIKKGRRGEANEARKVAMSLVKRLCELTLQETAGHFGVTSYGVVGWACKQVRAKQASNPRFQKRVEQAERVISQQKT